MAKKQSRDQSPPRRTQGAVAPGLTNGEIATLIDALRIAGQQARKVIESFVPPCKRPSRPWVNARTEWIATLTRYRMLCRKLLRWEHARTWERAA